MTKANKKQTKAIIELKQQEINTLLEALYCYEQNIQYEDEMTVARKNKTYKAIDDVYSRLLYKK